ncbi:T9SS type A sorting domain-containing protein [bacterium]|nr:T9SS type A sorting domain-containing protein [bacterium]
MLSRIMLVFAVIAVTASTAVGQEVCFPPLMASKEARNTKVLQNEIKEIARIRGTNHPALGWNSVELGDLNQDGYDDYAISSYMDTTFVYLGGDPLPQEPIGFVLGGTPGLRAGDVNGDGRVDIVTSRERGQKNDPDPEKKGRIRIYLNTGLYPFYASEPDMMIEGDGEDGNIQYLGQGDHSDPFMGIALVDMNGDDVLDLLATAYMGSVGGIRYCLYMGGYPYSSEPDYILSPPIRSSNTLVSNYYYTGDINGDGCDDLLVRSAWKITDTTGTAAWDLILGSRDMDFTKTGFTLRRDSGWYFDDLYACVADVNDDGYADIIHGDENGQYQGNIRFWHGRADLSGTIEPDDSLLNPNPQVLYYCRSANPVGDMNGDGTRDLMLAWVTDIFPHASSFYFYANRNDGIGRSAFGSVGIDPEVSFIDVTRIFPLGDVNGDGFDDVVLLGRPTRRGEVGLSNGIRVYGGNSKLVSAQQIPTLPQSSSLTTYPNPSSGPISLSWSKAVNPTAHLRILDQLGRTVHTQDIPAGATTTTWNASNAPPGVYFMQILHNDGFEVGKVLVR